MGMIYKVHRSDEITRHDAKFYEDQFGNSGNSKYITSTICGVVVLVPLVDGIS